MKPHEFWQEIHAPSSFDLAGPHSGFFPVTLDDGKQLRLPIRPLSDGEHALASLIINQASFAVVEALADDLAAKLKPFEIDIVVGLPTLGLTLAAEVARRLGHSRYVPLGTSRKFWYLDELSVPISSITTQQQKRLYIDPRMLPLLEGRRVALVDDVISSGTSIIASLSLLAGTNIEPVVIGAAMLQSDRWRERLADFGAQWPDKVNGVFSTPMLKKAGEGWQS
ncbi:phosphoribosyltransferase [Agrobacterium rosae]|uniref:phosphoribosyltransferase n=1 Tax=Agrobacterium rosae TaxID=1972867 RepID=UPI002A0EB10B|nr:phosphoribosyltransferase [Agrobacterium rosae]MDX8313578.1 phosphoribosyltransferase [Agrobacterium rosae]